MYITRFLPKKKVEEKKDDTSRLLICLVFVPPLTSSSFVDMYLLFVWKIISFWCMRHLFFVMTCLGHHCLLSTQFPDYFAAFKCLIVFVMNAWMVRICLMNMTFELVLYYAYFSKYCFVNIICYLLFKKWL